MYGAPDPQPRVPSPGELGPDPEHLGTERFDRLMRRIWAEDPRPPVSVARYRAVRRRNLPPGRAAA